ncbi:MAG: ribonucleotide reductase N-terminal alpha domain-containing protein [Promethearchaeota archaeon]
MKSFSHTAMTVLKKRYLTKDESGKVIESPEGMFRRVAKNIAAVDKKYGAIDKDIEEIEEEFYNEMVNLDFLPNSPTLMNAGRKYQQLAACFVLPIEDSIESIFEGLKNAAIIQQSGGGTGFNFSNLRPKGDLVKSSSGVASGPVSFMKIFDAASEQIRQGGMRRGANMGILRVDHPDIIEFITVKDDPTVLSNFNISVAITDEFMDAVKNNRSYPLINPRTKQVTCKVNAKKIFDLICLMAWKNADPGILFFDTINKTNPTSHLGEIESTNPCLTGDTLVAVADGRSAVSIKQLAEEGKDVPVFTEDGSGKITVRFMKHPRLTGKNNPVYKITLDSGDILKATANHIFFLRNGMQKRTDELQINDSLHIFTKVLQYQRRKITRNYHKKYWRIYNRDGLEKFEHTVIAEFFHNNGKPIPEGYIVHHIDYNSINNFPRNLKILSIKKYNNLHSKLIKGRNNPIYRIKSDPQKLKEYRSSNPVYNDSGKNNPRYDFQVTKKTKTKISISQKKFYKNNLEKKQLLSKISTVNWNDLINYKNAEKSLYQIDLEKLEECKQKTNLRCFLDGNSVMVEKNCEQCGKNFSINFSKREIGYCSYSCFMEFFNNNKKSIIKQTEVMRSTDKTHTEAKREKQLQCYFKLKTKLKREPFKKEWEEKCKQDSITYQLGPKFEFKTYVELKKAASIYNHKVIKIEYIGKEEVYNGTVDEFHTFFIGGFEEETRDKKKIQFIKTGNCGEVPLLQWEACNLGSINVSNFVKNRKINYKKLSKTVEIGVHFLDNVIDASQYPLEKIDQIVKGNRKIGLGIMGFADLLIQLGIVYGSEKSYEIARELMNFIKKESHKNSEKLAEDRAPFPNYKGSIYDGKVKLRNATLTSIAPTGTLSIIAGCSSSIEAIFAIVFRRKILEGQIFYDSNPYFEKIAKDKGFYSEKLMKEIAKQGSITNLTEIPKEIRKIFVTALEIPPEAHVKMQATFQKYVDNAVSKTVNLPNSATVDDVKKIYVLAHKLGCKGITIYRYGSKTHQVLSVGKGDNEINEVYKIKGSKCPECGTRNIIYHSSCKFCKNCGYSNCLL